MVSYTKDDLLLAVVNSNSYAETLEKLGKSKSGAAYVCLKKNITKHTIDTTHFINEISINDSFKKHWSDVLILDEGKTWRQTGSRLTKCLLEYGREYCCEICGLKNLWNERKITLEVDHIDGNWKNNKPCNLRFLCPNCHSQITCDTRIVTYYCDCGLPKRKKSSKCLNCHNKNMTIQKQSKSICPSKEELAIEINKGNWSRIGRLYGVSDNAVRKWAKKYCLI